MCRAAARHRVTAAVLGTTTGLTAAAYCDWSDDSTGLFAIGVGMVALVTLAGTAAVSAVTGAAARRAGSH
ncbi:hypothetical protein ACF1B0_13750 [Streptomyces anandii]|uniref:hypothetical protein n=1 Tax=Streptomyces anandii TaxID=285454 RepID=UPI0036F5E131